jgi:hypothetical protein
VKVFQESMSRCIAISVGALFLISIPAFAQNDIVGGKLDYRGFTVDVSVVQNAPTFAAIEGSLKNQIDIATDSGANPDIINFFRGRRIMIRHIAGDEPGRFALGRGVEIDAKPQPYEQPILLHELLHAYHALALPGGVENPDVLRFYDNALKGRRYPPASRKDKYVLSNSKEFFAVTASLYLWGNVDRQPHDRATLKASQPAYYEWLGQQFGVRK